MQATRLHIRNSYSRFLFTGSFLLITYCILTRSRLSLQYAFTGLELWYNNMIPTLLPFMILSGTLIRMGLTEGFVTIVYPLINPLFRVSRNACYVITMGFLCGFPMGAKCVNDMYVHGKISLREAEWLLSFCNNIGPVYFVSFALPLIGGPKMLPCVLGMYGLPLLYGLGLRYTLFRDLGRTGYSYSDNQAPAGRQLSDREPAGFFRSLDAAISSALQSILMLGGYMVLFNLLMLIPHLLLGQVPRYISPLLEITGGLKQLGDTLPLYSLILLPFGGLSCIAQTYTCIRDTGLLIGGYVLHKLALTALTALYYLLCLRLFLL